MPAKEADSPALNLNWVFGISNTVKHNAVTLSDGYSDRVCYTSAHTGVIYDKRTRRQTFLQGHRNTISCLAVTEDRSTLITADMGLQSMLVLWDSKTGNPLRNISQPHSHGIIALDLSPGGEWLATVGAPHLGSGEQEIALWSVASFLSDVEPRPVSVSAIPAGDVQFSVRFNMNALNELISNGRRRVYFWTSQYPTSSRFKYYSPPLRSKDFKQSVGDFVMSVFVPGSLQALTATTDGDLVVWDEQGITAQMGTRATDRRAVKLMRIHNQALTYLTTIGDYIVSGGKDGFVRFYDPLLRIVAWFEDLAAGPVNSLSFSADLPEKVSNTELADTLNRFIVPDFVVATEEGKLVAVQSASFEEFDHLRRRGNLILEAVINDAVAIACHPTRAECAILGASGTIQRWDMVSHQCRASQTFSKAAGSKVTYSRDGSFLVAGFHAGFVYILDTNDLSEIHVAKNSPAAVSQLAAAVTGRHVAVADEQHQVLLYACLPYKHIMRWEFVGKARGHHAPVVGLCFGESPAGHTRLFSLGSDRRIIEYNLDKSSPSAGLCIAYHQDLPGPSLPMALSFAPPLPYNITHSTQTLLLITDDSYKLKLYDPDKRACVSTYLGPSYGGPLQNLLMFKAPGSKDAFLAYTTAERVVGLVAWPLQGDPAQSLGLIAHPGKVLGVSISYDGRKLVTMGADGIVNIWDISTANLEAQAAASVKTPDRWEKVLDNPQLLEDLKDYFTYVQIKAQGENCMQERNTSGLVPVQMVPDVMRAAGYFPSEAAVADLMNHIQFLAQTGEHEPFEEIDFQTLLSLYINHRPLADVSASDITAAFTALGAPLSHGRLSREALLSQLQQLGEKMQAEELFNVLQALTGQDRITDALPTTMDAALFSAEILGFEDQEV